MVAILKRIKIYLEYYFKAETKYNIHPPFLFDFIDFTLDKDRIYYAFDKIQEASEILKRNETRIPSEPFSKNRQQDEFTVAEFYNKSGHPVSEYECLYRMALFVKSNNFLELGACVGMSGIAIALSNKSGKLISIEGNPFLSSICNGMFKRFKLNNAHCLNMEFESFLNSTAMHDFDFVFVDGDHQYDSTLKMIIKLLSITTDTAVLVIDDIHWSTGMYQAWKEIIRHPSIQCSLETERWGILFKNKQLTIGTYVYINEKFKPWKIGLY
jgi:predicted O-methyltransferase YrrM